MTNDDGGDSTVTVYVRLARDNGDERVVSFRIPVGIDSLELLDLGFAIDGNQAAIVVAPTPDRLLFDALGERQRALVAYLRERGFSPRFA